MNLEIDKPLENPLLKELFARRREAGDGEELRPVMEKLLSELVLNARLLSVVRLSKQPEASGDGMAVLPDETDIGFPMLTTPDGRSFYPAFIDEEELNRWDLIREAGLQTIQLGFDEYAHMVLDKRKADGLVINPFSDNLSLDRNSLRELRERKELQMTGRARKEVEQDTVIELGEPDEYPEDMVEAICQYAGLEPAIRRLWLRMMEQSKEHSYLLVAELAEGAEPEPLFESMAAEAMPYLGEMFLDMLPVTDGFARKAVEGVSPFYRRKA